MLENLEEWVARALDEHVSGRPSPGTARRAGTRQRVIEVVDSQERRWFAKQSASSKAWRAEVRAYADHVPALGAFAPTLRAADRDLSVLLLSAVPGSQPSRADRSATQRAGAALRLFHDSCSPRPQAATDVQRPIRRLKGILRRNPAVLTAQEAAFVIDQTQRLISLSPAVAVPCHGDYLPHNWLVDDVGTLRVIDFGESKWAPAAFDFSKLFFGPWWRRSDLAASFFDGYGRGLSDWEIEFVQRRMALAAVIQLTFGHDRGTAKHLRVGRARLADLMAGHAVAT